MQKQPTQQGVDIDYFESLLSGYDGDSKAVREDIQAGITREKIKAVEIAIFFTEGLQHETEIDLPIEPSHDEIHARIYRSMELRNLQQAVAGYREMIDMVTQDRFERWMSRIYDLINKPMSAGEHDYTI